MKNHAGVPFSSLNCLIIKIIFGILLVFGSLATILSEILASSRPPFKTLTVLCKLFKIERILMLKILPSLFSPTFIKTFILIKISSILHLYNSASPPPPLTLWLADWCLKHCILWCISLVRLRRDTIAVWQKAQIAEPKDSFYWIRG